MLRRNSLHPRSLLHAGGRLRLPLRSLPREGGRKRRVSQMWHRSQSPANSIFSCRSLQMRTRTRRSTRRKKTQSPLNEPTGQQFSSAFDWGSLITKADEACLLVKLLRRQRKPLRKRQRPQSRRPSASRLRSAEEAPEQPRPNQRKRQLKS